MLLKYYISNYFVIHIIKNTRKLTFLSYPEIVIIILLELNKHHYMVLVVYILSSLVTFIFYRYLKFNELLLLLSTVEKVRWTL